MSAFFFKDRDGQTPLPIEMYRGLKIKTIQTMGELDEHEESNIARGMAWLHRQSRDALDYKFWLVLHKKLFGDVWKWAGRVRTYELQNEAFAKPGVIWGELRQLEGDMRYWTEHSTFVNEELAARFHERLETIHPFPNGNGRFGRIVTEYFCQMRRERLPTWAVAMAATPAARRASYIAALDKARRDADYSALLNVMFS